MAVSVALDVVVLRGDKAKDIALYLRQLIEKHKPVDVCKALLDAVESEQLSPTVFRVFLSITEFVDCITLCMHQEFSIAVRLEGIKHYGQALSSSDHWQAVWQSLGGLSGILQYLSIISVREVKAFCKAIGKCNFGQQKSEERANAIEELVKAMNPGLYPEVSVKTPDERPLGSYAGYMILACSAYFVYSLMTDDTKKTIYNRCPSNHLVKNFAGPIRKYVDSKIWASKTGAKHGIVQVLLSELVHTEPPLPGKEKHFSATMEYSERLLETRLQTPEAAWPHVPTEADIYFGLLKRCSKRRISKERLHSIFKLGMRLITVSPKLMSSFSSRKQEFWTPITRFWIKWSDHWEDLFIRGLQLGFEGKTDIPSNLTTFLYHRGISDFVEDKIWSTLRLFYLHAPKVGVDIDAVSELEPFAKSRWTTDLFDRLPSHKAIPLLQMLLRANPNFDFLSCPHANSILNVSSIQRRRNVNASLYLIQRQLDSPLTSHRAEARERAVEACADYQNRSISSKEQPVRGQYARAMGLFAIASRSLEVYGDYVTWLTRFIRDPLTVKLLFHRDLVANNEVTALLSGIPDPIIESTTLSDISVNITQADAILMTFKEHHKTAKREPSYYASDWNAIDVVGAEALRTRIQRARLLKKSMNVSDEECYDQLWSKTLSQFSQPGADTASYIKTIISGLITDLPSKLLLKITKTVQEIEDTFRAKKSAGEAAEHGYNTMSRLANRCLVALAAGDDPSIAGPIIIKIIIDHPEASSWHRRLLGLGFFKRLPAASAQQLLLDFAEKIGEKLEEQSYVQVGEAATTPSTVKVTTVKYLAQILQGAEFLSAESSIDVLIELFKVATHPDIRQATLESMLSTLTDLATAEMQDSSTDISRSRNPITQKILAALDTVVPVVGSINERHVPTEQDWKQAESDLSLLPNPSTSLDQRPLWGVLMGLANNNKSLKSYFVQRLLLPALQTSIKIHRQWLALFLKKHRAGFPVDQLPAIPVTPTMLAHVFADFPQETPYRFYESWTRYLIFLLENPEVLVKFRSRLQADEKINTKPDVLHFLTFFGHDTETTFTMGTHKLISMINHSWKPSLLDAQQAVTSGHVRDVILNHLRIVLLRYDQHIKLWNSTLDHLRHPRGQQEWRCWKTDCYPILERVVVFIEELRTPRWSNNPNRSPPILPSTIRPRLWLLDYPLVDLSTDMSDQRAAELGHQLVGILSELLNKTDTLLKRENIIADMMTVSEKINDRERLQVGIVLGSFDQLKAAEESFRVSLAIAFFDKGLKAVEKDKVLKKQLADLLQHWQTSQVEDVREVVINLKGELTSSRLWQVAHSKD